MIQLLHWIAAKLARVFFFDKITFKLPEGITAIFITGIEVEVSSNVVSNFIPHYIMDVITYPC